MLAGLPLKKMIKNGHDTLKNSLFTQHFGTLTEPRRTTKGNFQYPLDEILFLCISGIVSGFREWEEIIFFGNVKIDWLRRFFPYKNGIPSHDILNNLFKRLNTDEFNTCFIKWVNSIATHSEGRVVAIDGKTICGNASNLNNSKIHIVTAFCTLNEISLGQIKVSDKSNEITAIPDLLDLIAVKGCIVTIDAMGCQKKIAEKIIEKKADYILMVKDNQAGLKEQIKKVFSMQKSEMIDIEQDLGHGRIEKRTCEVITKLNFLDDKEDWASLNSIIKLTSERTNKKTQVYSSEIRYYITSLKGNAKLINNSIRSHWAIENNLHWTLDVVMKEDGQLNYKGNTAVNLNMVRKMVMAMLGQEKTIKGSKNIKMKKAMYYDDYREMILKV